MLDCKQITERSDEYLSGDLGIYERIQFRIHLLMCTYCRRYVRQTKILIATLQRLSGAVSPDKAKQIVNTVRTTQISSDTQDRDDIMD